MPKRIKIILFLMILTAFLLPFAKATKAKSIFQLTTTPALAFTPTPELSPTPTPTISPQSQRLSGLEVQELDKRLDELETDLQDLDNPASGFWSALNNICVAMFNSGWLIFAIIFLFIFRSQIRDILKVLPSRISNVFCKIKGNQPGKKLLLKRSPPHSVFSVR